MPCPIRFGPEPMITTRGFVAGARVDAAVRRPDPFGQPACAQLGSRDAPGRADRVVAPAGTLRPPEVSGVQLLLGTKELLEKPRVDSVRDVVKRRPGARRAGIELSRAERFEEGLTEGPTYPHGFPDG